MRALRAGLMGFPVAQSLSPRLHQTAGAVCGVPVDYRLGAVAAEDVTALMEAWRAEGLDGFNLTAPHKGAGASWVDRLDPIAARIDAVNTVVIRDEETIGYNTDVSAFAAMVTTAPDRVVIFGAGGAVRAVVLALLDLDVSRIDVINRSVDRARRLADDLGPDRVRVHPPGSAERLIDGAELVVNGLPAVANEWVHARDYRTMADAGRVIDLGYGARVNALRDLVIAAERRFDDGIEMLARQGVAAFRLWTGVEPPLKPVLSALRSAVLD